MGVGFAKCERFRRFGRRKPRSLPVGVRTLGGVVSRRRLSSFGYLHFKAHRQLLGWIAGRVVASLVFQIPVYGVLGWHYVVERADYDADREVSGVDIQFLARREGKTHVLAFRVGDFPDHDVGRGIQLQRGGDQELRTGLVGIDVVTRPDTKIKSHSARLAAGDSNDRRRGEGDPSSAWTRHWLRCGDGSYERQQTSHELSCHTHPADRRTGRALLATLLLRLYRLTPS